MLKIQMLDARPRLGVMARNGKLGRVWINVAKPKRRRATAERLAQLARIDNPDALVRIR